MKDFLIFNYSWVKNSTYMFEELLKHHTGDIVTEKTLSNFTPSSRYKAVIVYLHETHQLDKINQIIELYMPHAYVIQHDTTDHEHVQHWTRRRPDLVFQRELTDDTKNFWGCRVFPMHFPMPSLYDESIQDKTIDVSFMATMTNPRRKPFCEHVLKLANGSLKHLNWHLRVTPSEVRQPDEFKQVANMSKIGMHYFGNSYDSHRIWELASAKAAIIMPELRLKSTAPDHMPFYSYCVIRDDFQDLEEKILYLLEDDRYKELANSSFNDYNQNHTPKKCFEKYHQIILDNITL